MQRLRCRFYRGEEVRYIAHLDIMRFWERALRRADIALAYSQGFAPHPRISLAAPLPVGVTSEAELMDVWLYRWMPPQSFTMRVKRQLPQGFDIFEVWEVRLNMPSLQSSLAFAEYHVKVRGERTVQDVENSLHSLLQAKELPWRHSRGDKMKLYDLRALIDDLWLLGHHDSLYTFGMRLRSDESGSGRPEQVSSALGFSQYPESIYRTKLIFKGESGALES